MKCRVCGKVLQQTDFTKKQWNYKCESYIKQGYVYCSKECSYIVMQEVRSNTMSKTNKKYASERMTNNNPTAKEEVRKKISDKRIGHAPTSRMGNGSGLTKPQTILLNKLNQYNAIAEYPIQTFKKKGSKFPSCYKADIAIPQSKIIIEIDGASHHLHQRKKDDIRRDTLLQSFGWRVIRFWNKEVFENVQLCVDKITTAVCAN